MPSFPDIADPGWDAAGDAGGEARGDARHDAPGSALAASPPALVAEPPREAPAAHVTAEVAAPLDGGGVEAAERKGRGPADLMLAAAALALAAVGQFYFKNMRYPYDGALFFLLSIGLFLTMVARHETVARSQRTGPGAVDWLRARLRANPVPASLVILSLALTYTVLRTLKVKLGGEDYSDVFVLWLVSIGCYVAAFVRPQPVAWRPGMWFPRLLAWLQQHEFELLLVMALTAMAASLRLTALGLVPNIVSGDEGRIGLLARSALDGELRDPFGTIFGHSTLYLFLMAASMKVLGVSVMSLRLTSALAGILTVPALYVFARRFFGIRVAIVAVALLAFSHIHLHFSRIIVAGSIQDALFATVAFYFLLTGLDRRSVLRLITAGLVVGFHLYIYMGARLIILLIPVYLLALLITNPKLVRENVGNLLAAALAFMVVAAPMALWAFEHQADFMARANQVGVFQSGWLVNETVVLNKSQYAILAQLFAQALLTVNAEPAIGFYNAKIPMLDFASGAVYMLGLAYSLFHATDRRHLLLNGWFWSGVIVGGALVVLPAIAAYRILVILPAVCIFVGIGWDRLVELGTAALPRGRWVAGGLTVLFVALIANLNYNYYFKEYAPSCLYEDWGTRFASYMGENLGKAGPTYSAYLFGFPRIWYGIHPSVDFLSGNIPIQDIREPLAPGAFPAPGGNAIFFFTPDRAAELAALQVTAPGGQVEQVYDCDQLMMTIYRVDRGSGQ